MAAHERLSRFQQTKWYGGYSDDDYLGVDGSFRRSTNTEIRRFPRQLRLQKLHEEQSAGTFGSAQVKDELTTSQFGDTIAVTSTGKVFRRASGGTTWALVYTDTSARAISDIYEYNDYLYWTTADRLHRVPMGDTGTNVTWTTVTENYQTLTTSTTNGHPMMEAFNNLFVGDGNVLDMLSPASVWTAAKITFFIDDEIRNVTFDGTLIKVYARKQSNKRNEGTIYFWNGVSTAYQEVTHLQGLFHAACQLDGVDHFLAGHRPMLYRLDGLTPVPLKLIPDLTASNALDSDVRRVSIHHNAMRVHDGVIYFGILETTISGTSYIEKGLWSWGRLNADYPFSLNLDVQITADAITSVFSSEGKLYFASVTGSTVSMWCVNPAKFQATGDADTRVFEGLDAQQIKEAYALGISFDPLAAGEQVDIYCRINRTSSWGDPILTASAADDGSTVTYKHLTSPFTGQEFNMIELRVKLTCGSNSSTTPKFNQLAVLYGAIKTQI